MIYRLAFTFYEELAKAVIFAILLLVRFLFCVFLFLEMPTAPSELEAARWPVKRPRGETQTIDN